MKAVKIVFTSLIHVITCAVIQSYVLAALIWYYDIPLQTYLVCAAIVLALLAADLLAGRFLLRDVGLKRGWRAVLHYTDLLLMLPCLYIVFSDLFQHGFAMTLKEAAPVVSVLLADALQITERARLDRKAG